MSVGKKSSWVASPDASETPTVNTTIVVSLDESILLDPCESHVHALSGESFIESLGHRLTMASPAAWTRMQRSHDTGRCARASEPRSHSPLPGLHGLPNSKIHCTLLYKISRYLSALPQDMDIKKRAPDCVVFATLKKKKKVQYNKCTAQRCKDSMRTLKPRILSSSIIAPA